MALFFINACRNFYCRVAKIKVKYSYYSTSVRRNKSQIDIQLLAKKISFKKNSATTYVYKWANSISQVS